MSSVDQSIWPPPGIRQRRIPLLFYTSKRPLLCLAAKEAKWHQRKLLRNYLWISLPELAGGQLYDQGLRPGPTYSDRYQKKVVFFSHPLYLAATPSAQNCALLFPFPHQTKKQAWIHTTGVNPGFRISLYRLIE